MVLGIRGPDLVLYLRLQLPLLDLDVLTLGDLLFDVLL